MHFEVPFENRTNWWLLDAEERTLELELQNSHLLTSCMNWNISDNFKKFQFPHLKNGNKIYLTRIVLRLNEIIGLQKIDFFSFLPPQFNRIILLPGMLLQPCPHIQLSSLHFPIWGQMLLPQDSPLDSSDLLYAFIASSTSLFHFEITVDPYMVIRNNKKVSGYLLLSFSQY